MNGEIIDLPLSKLIVDEVNYRQEKWLGDEKDLGLIASIKEVGCILIPLWVRELSDGRFGVIAGNRRFHAACEIGLNTVPVMNFGILSDEEAIKYSVIENEARKKAPYYDKIKAICKIASDIILVNEKTQTSGLSSQLLNKIHQITGLSPSTIERYLCIGFRCPKWFLQLLRPEEIRDREFIDDILYWFKQKRVDGKITIANAYYFSELFVHQKSIQNFDKKLEFLLRNFTFASQEILNNMIQKILNKPQLSVKELQEEYEIDKHGFYTLQLSVSPVERQRLRIMTRKKQKKLNMLLKDWVLERLDEEEGDK